jgi:hypothetical protein
MGGQSSRPMPSVTKIGRSNRPSSKAGKNASVLQLVQLFIQFVERLLHHLPVLWILAGFQLLEHSLPREKQIFPSALTRRLFYSHSSAGGS